MALYKRNSTHTWPFVSGHRQNIGTQKPVYNHPQVMCLGVVWEISKLMFRCGSIPKMRTLYTCKYWQPESIENKTTAVPIISGAGDAQPILFTCWGSRLCLLWAEVLLRPFLSQLLGSPWCPQSSASACWCPFAGTFRGCSPVGAEKCSHAWSKDAGDQPVPC